MSKAKFPLVCFGALAFAALLPAVSAGESTTPAQEQRQSRSPLREERLKQLDEKLNLTAEQEAKVAAIWDKAAKERRAIRQDGEVKRRELRQQRRETMREARMQVRSVLTPEQQKAFDAMPRAKSARRGSGA